MPAGTSTGAVDPKAVSAEVPLSRSVGWKLISSVMLIAAYGAASAVAPLFPAAADAIVAHLPTVLVAAAPLIKGGAATLAAWLISRAKTQHDQAMVTALAKVPPDDMSQFYK